MMRLDCAAAVEVRNSARDFQDSRVGTRAQPEPVNREFEQALARAFDLAMHAKIARAHLRVAEKFHPGKALELNFARTIHPLANRRRRFAGDSIGQVLELNRGHLDMDIDSIEQRARDSRAIALN